MAIIVYDVTSETSFSSCEKWLERVKSKKPGTPLLGLFWQLIHLYADIHERVSLNLTISFIIGHSSLYRDT